MAYPILKLTQCYVQRGWTSWLAAVALVVLAPLTIEVLLWARDILVDRTVFGPDASGIYHLYLGVTFVGFGLTAPMAHEGFAKRLRGLPVSSRMVMTWLMASGGVAVGTLSLVTTALYRWLFDVNWPLAVPMLYFVVGVLIFQCAYWNLCAFSFRRLAVWCGSIALVLGWLLWRYEDDAVERMRSLGALEALGVCAAAVVAHTVGWRSYAAYRAGDAVPSAASQRVAGWLRSRFYETRDASAGRLQTPRNALGWFAWHSIGPWALLIALTSVGVLTVSASAQTLTNHRRSAPESTGLILLVMPALLGFGLGAMLGLDLFSKRQTEMKRYLAACPVSDRELSKALLWNAGQMTIVGWLGLLVAALTPYTWRWESVGRISLGGVWLTSKVGAGDVPMTLAASLAVIWTVVGLTASFLWTGRMRLLRIAMPAMLVLAVVGIALLNFVLPRDVAAVAWRGLLWSGSGLAIGGTLAALLLALHRRLISLATLSVAVSTAAMAVGLCWWIVPGAVEYRAAVSGGLVLSVAPLATAPLAIAWNRHR